MDDMVNVKDYVDAQYNELYLNITEITYKLSGSRAAFIICRIILFLLFFFLQDQEVFFYLRTPI
jgi:hypothetical protein